MRQTSRIALAIGLMLVGFAVIRAQNPTREETLVFNSNLVTVNVIVTDANGKYVKGLTAEQFAIYEENVKQKIAHFSTGAAPVSIGIVYEFDPADATRTSAVLSALKHFVSTLGQQDTFFFTAFSPQGSVTAEFIPSSRQTAEHLSPVKPDGPTGLYDVLYSAAGKLRQSPNLKRALLVVSDGADNNSERSYKEVRDRLREFDAQIYTIGIRERDQFAGYHQWMVEDLTRETGRRSLAPDSEAGLGRAMLAEMSRVSGGASYSAESESEPELTWICTQVANELREQYTLGFYPGKVAPDVWHKIRVVVDSPRRLSLSYREGYQLRRYVGMAVGYVNVWQTPM